MRLPSLLTHRVNFISIQHFHLQSLSHQQGVLYTYKMERRARIELATLAWKAKVIPFYERRIVWCPRGDSNSHASRHWLLRPACLPFHHQGIFLLIYLTGSAFFSYHEKELFAERILNLASVFLEQKWCGVISHDSHKALPEGSRRLSLTDINLAPEAGIEPTTN